VSWSLTKLHDMKTLKQLVEEVKCRKGKSAGVTKEGAFWFAVEPIPIRSYGGDGVGQSTADCVNYLQLRHYRSGLVKAVVNFHSWHQNSGTSNSYKTVSILDCSTVEDVIVVLKAVQEDNAYGHGDVAYSDRKEEWLTDVLTEIGMPVSEKAPDEE